MPYNNIIYLCPSSISASNPCSIGNGNCTHLCLLSATNQDGFGCGCPDGMVLAGDGKKCSRKHTNHASKKLEINFSILLNFLTVCPVNSFICDNANCIPSVWECDDVDDCGDNSDEDHCDG